LDRLWKKGFFGLGISRKWATIPHSHAFIIGSSGGSEFAGNLIPPTANLSGKKIVVLYASQIS